MKVSLVGSAIGALIVANAAAFVAVEKHFEVSADAARTPPITAAPLSSSIDVGPSSSAPATSTTADAIRSPEVFVIATNANDAWRASNSGGGCNSSVTVQTTTDGGRTWSDKARSPAGAVDGISISGQGHVQVSGQASDGCAHKIWSLHGNSWSTSSSASWVSGGATSSDVLHDGQRKRACKSGQVIDLATAGDSAYILCSTGEVRKVSDNKSATMAYQGPGMLSIATAENNTLIVARSVKNCDGVELATISDGSAKRITCVKGANKAADLTFAGDDGWLVAAHDTWTGQASGNWSKS